MGHQGPKTSKIVFLGDTNRLLSTGFGKQFERQISIWNVVGFFFQKEILF
jgi:hypothetical protein